MEGTYRWDLALLKGADDAIDLELPVDVGLLHLEVGGSVHRMRSHGCCITLPCLEPKEK